MTGTAARPVTTIPTSRIARAQLRLDVLDVRPELVPTEPENWHEAFKRWGLNAQPQECFWTIAYDASMVVASVTEIARGSHLTTDIHLPTLLASVLVAGCERFQVMHNHPGSNPNPTAADYEATRQIMVAANACGLYFDDHVILTPRGHYFSMVDEGFMVPIPYVKASENVLAVRQ